MAKRFGMWIKSPGWDVELFAANQNLDWLTVDCQHGNWTKEAMERFFAGLGVNHPSECRPWVRTKVNPTMADVGQLLDAGAWGLVFPFVESADDVHRYRNYMSYPPNGSRSYGSNIGLTNTRADSASEYVSWSTNIELISIVETRIGLDNLESIYAQSDVVLFGLKDLELSMALSRKECLASIRHAIDKLDQYPVCGLLGASDSDRIDFDETIVNLGSVQSLLSTGMTHRRRQVGLP